MSRNSYQANIGRISLFVPVVLLVTTAGWSRSYKVLFDFKYPSIQPSSGLTTDAQGNAYGVTLDDAGGSVYELSPSTGFHLLHQFSSNPLDPGGRTPLGNLIFDAAGNLYGTTSSGGRSNNGCDVHGSICGVVYELSPPASGVGQWTETVLYNFCAEQNCSDGSVPEAGVIFDSAGNLYGTTVAGGSENVGTVFELSPAQGGWQESVLHNFSFTGRDGYGPSGALIFDSAGNLYGTTGQGGSAGDGAVFELSPSTSGWVETILHSFDLVDGNGPTGVVMDELGNLYGAADQGGTGSCDGGCGTVFELSPNAGNWTESTLYNFSGGLDGANPGSGLIFDSHGNLYGTTLRGGGPDGCQLELGCGTVFKLTSGSGGLWTETLFRFPASGSLGGMPSAPVTLDSLGNVYGTTTEGGAFGDGVAFEIKQ